MRKAYRRNSRHAQEFCRLVPAMTGNDLQTIVGQNWIREAETLNRIGNLPNLPL
jgi:hypothetical protein